MADSETQTSESLLNSVQIQTDTPLESDSLLDQTLQQLELFLFFFGFHQTSFLSSSLSWAAFVLVGVSTPVLILELCRCTGCEEIQITKFELYIVASQASLAAVSLLCISHNLRKYGVRKFLFLDRFHGQLIKLQKEYVQKIQGFFHMLLWCILPVFILKITRETIRIIYIRNQSWWLSIAILLALIISWAYVNAIFLSACILFSLVCSLLVIHFDDYGRLLQVDSDALFLLEEHRLLTHHLSKISHRFRIYLLLAFLVVTASQFMTLFQTTGNHHIINFVNGGDFAVSSIVQVVGLTLCLHAAAKISHRAQGVGSLASRWHALVTCSSTDGSQSRLTNTVGNFEANQDPSFFINYSESDLESLDTTTWPTNPYFTSHMTSFQKRQALVQPRWAYYLRMDSRSHTDQHNLLHRAIIGSIRSRQNHSFYVELTLRSSGCSHPLYTSNYTEN